MEVYQAIILGIVQGLTEFLPISSSGHLVLVQHLFGLNEAELIFDVCLHVGTLIAVLFYFRQDLLAMLFALGDTFVKCLKKEMTRSTAWENPEIKMATLICVGTLPTVIIGLAFRQIAETLFASIGLVGVSLIITGLFLWLTRRIKPQETSIGHFTVTKSVIIGIVQGLSITPGISRSGSTIAAGLFLGLDREQAARFSFLLSIPAITGAAVLSLKGVGGSVQIPFPVLLSGMAVAGVSGYLALSFLVFIVKKGKLYAFAPYCWLAGSLALGAAFF